MTKPYIWLWGACLPALLLAIGCGEKNATVQRPLAFMGDRATIHAPADEKAALAIVAQTLSMYGERIYPLIDVYSPESEISRANRIAHMSRFPISRDTQRLLENAQDLSMKLGGAFDISDATLRHLWDRHFRSDPEDLLPEPLIRATLRGVGSGKYDVRDHSLLLLTPDTQLDVNEFAKPYVTDRAVAHLRQMSVGNVMIELEDFGRGLGRASATKNWTRDIPHPDQNTRPIGRVSLPDGSAYAVAGLPHHYANVGGEKVARIIDPRSGWPAEGSAMVFVLGPSAAEAYSLARALFVLDIEAGAELIGLMNRYEALYVHHEPFGISMTPGFAPFFTADDDSTAEIRMLEEAVPAVSQEEEIDLESVTPD